MDQPLRKAFPGIFPGTREYARFLGKNLGTAIFATVQNDLNDSLKSFCFSLS